MWTVGVGCWGVWGLRLDRVCMGAAMLVRVVGGRLSNSPPAVAKAAGRYLDETNVLATTVSTSTAKTVLTDFLPVTSEAASEGKEMFESGLAEWLAAEVCSAAPNSIQS